MKMVSKISLGLATAAVLFLAGCTGEAQPAKTETAAPTITEESLGLRKTDLYTEQETVADQTNYGKGSAGSGYKIKRAFQDAPPMIPHDVEGMLPITISNNACTGCHMPAVATSMGATAIPASHFMDFRPKHNFDGKDFTKSVDNMKNEISVKKISKLAGARFNCSQCHAPQSAGNLAVENTFEAQFTSKDGASKSSWSGSKLTEGLDTLAD